MGTESLVPIYRVRYENAWINGGRRRLILRLTCALRETAGCETARIGGYFDSGEQAVLLIERQVSAGLARKRIFVC